MFYLPQSFLQSLQRQVWPSPSLCAGKWKWNKTCCMLEGPVFPPCYIYHLQTLPTKEHADGGRKEGESRASKSWRSVCCYRCYMTRVNSLKWSKHGFPGCSTPWGRWKEVTKPGHRPSGLALRASRDVIASEVSDWRMQFGLPQCLPTLVPGPAGCQPEFFKLMK